MFARIGEMQDSLLQKPKLTAQSVNAPGKLRFVPVLLILTKQKSFWFLIKELLLHITLQCTLKSHSFHLFQSICCFGAFNVN